MEYALYKGDTFIKIGTEEELAKELAIKIETLKYYATPTYARILQKRKYATNSIILVKLDDLE